MMNHEDTVLLDLLAYGLFGQPIMTFDGPIDWHEVLSSANAHSVTALLYISLKALPDIPEDVLQTARQVALSLASRNERLLSAQSDLLATLSKAHIPCAVLKGSSVALCYPNCGLRTLGDIDLLIEPSMVSEAGELLKQGGYIYDHGHDFHECYVKKGIGVELHKEVSRFPETAKGIAAREYMRSALCHTRHGDINGHGFAMLDVSYQLVSLLAHTERHMTANGIGLRQLCDWAVSVAYDHEFITEEVLSVLAHCGLLTFAQALTKTCTIFLGLPRQAWAEDVDEQTAAMILDELVAAEAVYNPSAGRRASNALIPKDSLWKSSMLGNYIRSANRKARSAYSAAKFPLALPFFWVFYPIRYLVRAQFQRRSIAPLFDTLSVTKKRKQLYGRLELFQ